MEKKDPPGTPPPESSKPPEPGGQDEQPAVPVSASHADPLVPSDSPRPLVDRDLALSLPEPTKPPEPEDQDEQPAVPVSASHADPLLPPDSPRPVDRDLGLSPPEPTKPPEPEGQGEQPAVPVSASYADPLVPSDSPRPLVDLSPPEPTKPPEPEDQDEQPAAPVSASHADPLVPSDSPRPLVDRNLALSPPEPTKPPEPEDQDEQPAVPVSASHADPLVPPDSPRPLVDRDLGLSPPEPTKPPEPEGQGEQPAVPVSASHADPLVPPDSPKPLVDRDLALSPPERTKLPEPADQGEQPAILVSASHADPLVPPDSPRPVDRDLGLSPPEPTKPPEPRGQDEQPAVPVSASHADSFVQPDSPRPSGDRDLGPSQTEVTEEQDKEARTLFEPIPSLEKQKDSAAHKFFSKVPDMFSSRRSSRKSEDKTATQASPTVDKTEIIEAADQPPSEEQRRKSALRQASSESPRRRSSVGFDVYGRRKSQVYNPFTSFEKHVSISQTDEDVRKAMLTGLQQQFPHFPETRPRSSITLPKAPAVLSKPPSLRALRSKNVSVADLTKQDISVCFFPEEPDWGDDDDLFRSLPSSRRVSEEPPELPKKPEEEEEEEEEEEDITAEKAYWDSRLVYLIVLTSYSVSFSNVYHFPALVYEYGGVSFLIPYTFFTVVMGYPLHFLESSLGQYSQSGPVKVWDCAPIARGLGWAMFFLCLFIAYFYNMYAAYALIYFSRCFKSILPWEDCDTLGISNFSCVPRMCARTSREQYTPSEHYFFDNILQVNYTSKILEDGLGKMNWAQVLTFFLAWVVVYFSIIESVTSIGKVAFYLIVLPYFSLWMLLAAGFMLEGSAQGMHALFAINYEKLLNLQVWRAAAEQVFFELGVCQGTPLAYGSHCLHRNPTHIDSAIVCVVNYFTSILCAVIIFNILGALSVETGLAISEVVQQAPGLVYVVYPEAIGRVPGSQFWCVTFFLMLFLISVGTHMAVMETVMTIIFDQFENVYAYRWIINLLFCCGLFSIGMILCTSNGFYIVNLLNIMTAMMPRLPIAICMVGTIVFIYGITKFCEDMHFMLDYYPNLFLRLCLYVTPFILFVLTIPSWIFLHAFQIMKRPYVIDAIAVGWFTIGFILIWIIFFDIYWCAYCKYFGRFNDILKPLPTWGPKNLETRTARAEFSSENVIKYSKEWNRDSLVRELQKIFK